MNLGENHGARADDCARKVRTVNSYVHRGILTSMRDDVLSSGECTTKGLGKCNEPGLCGSISGAEINNSELSISLERGSRQFAYLNAFKSSKSTSRPSRPFFFTQAAIVLAVPTGSAPEDAGASVEPKALTIMEMPAAE